MRQSPPRDHHQDRRSSSQALDETPILNEESLSTVRRDFLRLAIPFQSGLMLLAIIVAWLIDRPLWSQLRFSTVQLGVAMLATLPMLVFLGVTYRSRFAHFAQIREILRNSLGKSLLACHWYDLLALALLAGISEEFLFRGVIEPSFQRWGFVTAVILCNLLFGACHAVTPAYAVYAALLGAYLSLTRWLTDEPNLMVPIICHSLYDFVAFIIVRNAKRQHDMQSLPITNLETPPSNNPNNPLPPLTQ